MIEQILIIAFIICFLIQVIYYLGAFTKLAFYSQKKNSSVNYPTVSIVICAQNEATNLSNHLIKIIEQDYPSFEIIVVNDGSTDQTADVLESFSKQYKHLKYFYLSPNEKQFTGKKEALTIGVSKAENEVILTTDADCFPNSNNWIKEMVDSYSADKKIVLGIGPTVKTKGILNQLIRYETCLTAIQYLSYSLHGFTYMGVGRNLLYEKKLFIETGLHTHFNITSGDDDLLIKDIANKSNTSIHLSTDSFMYSKGVDSLKKWYRQKLRHQSTGKHYKVKTQLLLGLFIISKLLLNLIFLTLLFFNNYHKMIYSTYALYIVIMAIIMYPILKKLDAKDLFIGFPLLDFILNLFIFISGLTATFKHEPQWK